MVLDRDKMNSEMSATLPDLRGRGGEMGFGRRVEEGGGRGAAIAGGWRGRVAGGGSEGWRRESGEKRESGRRGIRSQGVRVDLVMVRIKMVVTVRVFKQVSLVRIRMDRKKNLDWIGLV